MSNDDDNRDVDDSDSDGEERTALSKVRYTFSCTDFPDVVFRVRRLRLVESLSQPYELELDVVTRDRAFSFDDVLGAACELVIDREAISRSVFGIIHRFDFYGVATDDLVVRVHVVPALALMGQRVNCRIWQDQSVQDIVKQLLDEGLPPFQREYRWELDRAPVTRDYCVQYNESDLGFMHRLLEEEGIAYYFEHQPDAGGEVVVFVDDNRMFPEVETLDASPEIPLAVTNEGGADLETLTHFDISRALHSTSATEREFDFERPTSPVEYEQAGADNRDFVREYYRYAPHRFLGDPGPSASRRFAESLAVGGTMGRAAGNVTGLAAGSVFEVTVYGETTRYLVTRITHVGDCPEEVVAEGLAPTWESQRYENSFVCIPFDTPYRPALRTHKPRIQGPQTATVVSETSDGAPVAGGDDIYVDEFGRVRVKFHWDRRSEANDHWSCWIRVRQNWAGAGFGAIFTPRVGMEVVVEFSDGDPDQPLITGCVYNGSNPPPYPLPGEKTKSTIKTQSSPPSSPGYNEICFEDQSGGEQINLHAQRDLNETVLRNHSTNVGANQSISVGANQTTSVTKDQKNTVDGNRTVAVTKDQTTVIEGTRQMLVSKLYTEEYLESRESTITGTDKLEVSEKISHSTPEYLITADTKMTIEAGGAGGSKVVMNASETTSDAKTIKLTGLEKIVAKVGIHTVTLDNAKIAIANSTAKIEVTPAMVTVVQGANKIELSLAGVAVTGVPMIKLN